MFRSRSVSLLPALLMVLSSEEVRWLLAALRQAQSSSHLRILETELLAAIGEDGVEGVHSVGFLLYSYPLMADILLALLRLQEDLRDEAQYDYVDVSRITVLVVALREHLEGSRDKSAVEPMVEFHLDVTLAR